MKVIISIIVILLIAGGGYYYFITKDNESITNPAAEIAGIIPSEIEKEPVITEFAIFSGGSFWDLENKILELDGVISTRVGYTGGDISKPSYDLVETGTTGHVEAVEVMFDSNKLKYKDLVEYFLKKAHDPTKIFVSGSGKGSQKRSVIFYMDEKQKEMANIVLRDVKRRKYHPAPIVTTIEPAMQFYEAEEQYQRGNKGAKEGSYIIEYIRNIKR